MNRNAHKSDRVLAWVIGFLLYTLILTQATIASVHAQVLSCR
jgi:quinol-cytochrome oxidoreductase complex cytochrome b subunit